MSASPPRLSQSDLEAADEAAPAVDPAPPVPAAVLAPAPVTPAPAPVDAAADDDVAADAAAAASPPPFLPNDCCVSLCLSGRFCITHERVATWRRNCKCGVYASASRRDPYRIEPGLTTYTSPSVMRSRALCVLRVLLVVMSSAAKDYAEAERSARVKRARAPPPPSPVGRAKALGVCSPWRHLHTLSLATPLSRRLVAKPSLACCPCFRSYRRSLA